MAESTSAPGVVGLFRGFLILGLTGFGGVLPLARHMVVEQRRWLTGAEFSELLSLCQFLPGPNVASITVCLGSRLRGPAGALVALAGFLVVPWSIGFALGALFLHYATVGPLQDILRGVSAVGAGKERVARVRGGNGDHVGVGSRIQRRGIRSWYRAP